MTEPLWKLFAEPKFKAQLCAKLADAWIPKEERPDQNTLKMDHILRSKWKTLVRHKVFALVRHAAASYMRSGHIQQVNGDEVEERIQRFTTFPLRDEMERNLSREGVATSWAGKSASQQAEDAIYMHSSHTDAVAHSNPILKRQSIESRIKKVSQPASTCLSVHLSICMHFCTCDFCTCVRACVRACVRVMSIMSCNEM